MIYLDTSTCVGLLRGDISVSPATMRSIAPTELGIPVVVESELLIAAMAMRHDATLLTCSPDLYRRIPGLKMVECGNDLEESLRLC